LSSSFLQLLALQALTSFQGQTLRPIPLASMFRLASSVAFALLAPAIAQDCDPQKESCDVAAAADEMTSEMRVSLLQGGLRGSPIDAHGNAASEGEKPERRSELEKRKKALLMELDNVDSELASMNSTDGWMVEDPSQNEKKCGSPGDPSRTFELSGWEASEQGCKQRCIDDYRCKYFSGQFYGTTWCIGCSGPMWTYAAKATAYKKTGGGFGGCHLSCTQCGYNWYRQNWNNGRPYSWYDNNDCDCCGGSSEQVAACKDTCKYQ